MEKPICASGYTTETINLNETVEWFARIASKDSMPRWNGTVNHFETLANGIVRQLEKSVHDFYLVFNATEPAGYICIQW